MTHKRQAILYVYMPCMSTQSGNDDIFLECLGFLAATIEFIYTLLTDDILSKVHIPVVALNCKNVDCTDPSHVAEVNTFYENVISAIVSADTELTEAFANVRDGRRGKGDNRPGWSDYVDELHKSDRECFLLWRDTGKPRRGQIFDMMQQSRARFKYAIRAVKQRENAMRRESLATFCERNTPLKDHASKRKSSVLKRLRKKLKLKSNITDPSSDSDGSLDANSDQN